MARIRSIKPEFFTSADIVSLTPLARLFFISLWCEADREGRLSWNLSTLKLRYFPGDNCDLGELANELIDAGLVTPYEAEGKPYAEIPTFKQHQVINNREAESVIPPRACDAPSTRESGVSGEGKEGREGKGREGNGIRADANEEKSGIFIPLSDGSDYEIPLSDIAEWEIAFPYADVEAELRKARAWSIANPKQRKTPGGVKRFLAGWVSRSNDRPANKPPEPPPTRKRRQL